MAATAARPAGPERRGRDGPPASAGVGRLVWLLSTDVWTQTLAVARAKMAGLSPEQQAGALGFEAEGLSGHPAVESAVGFVKQPAEGQDLGYWLVQTPAGPLVLVDEAVARAGGGRLAGVAHPGGLPAPLRSPGAGSWERVELWPDAVVMVEARDRGAPQVETINFDPQGGRWQGQVEQARARRGAAEHLEMLVSADVRLPAAPGDSSVVRLSDDADLRRWLARWAAVLGKKNVAVPHVKPPLRPLSEMKRRIVGALATGALAGLCAAHYFLWLQPTYNATAAELKTVQEPAVRLADVQKQTKDLEAKSQEFDQQLKWYQRDLEAFGVQKQALRPASGHPWQAKARRSGHREDRRRGRRVDAARRLSEGGDGRSVGPGAPEGVGLLALERLAERQTGDGTAIRRRTLEV